MADIAAMAVSAAGELAGGEAAQALMGNTNAPSGGGIKGLTTSKGSGKDGQTGSATQIDPSTALAYFQKAASDYQGFAMQGLNFYQNQMSTAIQQINAGYKASNQALAPLSNASNQALNQELRMMGITPVASSAQYSDDLLDMGTKYAGLADQMSAAEKITDPTQRATARSNIISSFQTAETPVDTDALIKALGPNPAQATLAQMFGDPRIATDNGWYQEVLTQDGGIPGTGSVLDYLNDGSIEEYGGDLARQWRNENASYTSQVNAIKKQAADQQTAAAQLGQIQAHWNNSYTDDAQLGYTGDQVTQQLESTPGYQFTLGQGTDALSASQAAKGMLNSGNTATALESYGQGLALNSNYLPYMQMLANTVNQGSPATNNIAANDANQGNNIGSAYQNIGQAGLQTYTGIGQAYYNSDTNQGQVWNQDMLANMQAQNTAILQSRNAQSQASNAGLAAGVALNGQAMQQQQSNSVGAGYLNI